MPDKEYTIKQAIDSVSDVYRKISNSHWGTLYDIVNAGLYVASPFTGGATLPAAMLMTGVQGAGAAADVASKGVTVNNVIDIASMIPGFGLAEKGVKAVSKPVMRSVGKTTKIIKNATKYVPTVENNIVKGIRLGKTHPTFLQLMMKDPKYIPMGTLVYGEDLLNHGLNMGQVVNDLRDSKDVESYRQGGIVKRVESGKSGIYIKPEKQRKVVQFEDWYKTVPKEKNDTITYNLRRAFELAPKEQLDNFVKNPDAHLYSTYLNKDTGEYEFMKRKDHPTIQYELDWYNSDDPEAIEFRKKYRLDTSQDYYKYIPIGKSGIHIKPENRGKFTTLKKRTGKSASWFKAHGTPAQKKMATFALNARKWNKGKKK